MCSFLSTAYLRPGAQTVRRLGVGPARSLLAARLTDRALFIARCVVARGAGEAAPSW
jgi:hypothetical protein